MNDQITPSKEQTAAAFSGPAYAISNFMIHPLSADVFRLSFIESPLDGSNPQYRTAVILDADGMRNLADLLFRFSSMAKAGNGQ